jgi:hypothetical protein
MESAEARALSDARENLASVGYGNRDASRAVREAERALAASIGEPWAEVIDFGVQWDSSAPLPHIISNGSTTVLLCLANVPRPDWDGTNPRSVSTSDEGTSIELTFRSCSSIKFGSPNDEVLHGHPLYGRGLEFYAAHRVHNSSWIGELEAIQASHHNYRGPGRVRGDHYILAFHDETFEAVADRVDVRTVQGTLDALLATAARSIVSN